MTRALGVTCRWLSIPAVLFSFSLAAHQITWYLDLPRHASARFCGNCFLSSVGVPVEIALLAMACAGAAWVGRRHSGQEAVCWFCAAAGILATPMVIGVPLFLFGLAPLLTGLAVRRE
jgi:hypothetical protein